MLSRNNEYFTTDLPERWRLNYNRRLGHKKTGYFSKNNAPYVTFDNLKYTDVYDLVEENLDIVMQEHWHYMQAGIHVYCIYYRFYVLFFQMFQLTQRNRQDYCSEETEDSTNTVSNESVIISNIYTICAFIMSLLWNNLGLGILINADDCCS